MVKEKENILKDVRTRVEWLERETEEELKKDEEKAEIEAEI